jgi:phospholipid/cholesterol/gamma-HCH transport system permease protein
VSAAPKSPGSPIAGASAATTVEGASLAGSLTRFSVIVLRDTITLKVFRHFGEALRQAGILITGSLLVIVGLMFTIGTTCGIESAYLTRATGASAYAGIFAALCDLREAGPYAFGYMMAAKVGTGIVAEIGAMRVSDEVDALEVMGLDSLVYLCATRLLACWMVIPFIYAIGIGASYLASYLAVVVIVGDTSAGGYNLIFWFFQDPLDVLYSGIKGMAMATMIVLVGAYFGYTARGGPVGVGQAAAKSMVVNVVGVHVIGMVGTMIFWGTNPRAPIGG